LVITLRTIFGDHWKSDYGSRKKVLLKADFGRDRIVDMMVGGQQPIIF